jgi:hypothetical protein
MRMATGRCSSQVGLISIVAGSPTSRKAVSGGAAFLSENVF